MRQLTEREVELDEKLLDKNLSKEEREKIIKELKEIDQLMSYQDGLVF